MAFREKSAWIAVVATLTIWGYYFFVLAGAVGARALDGSAIYWLFVWCLSITLVIMLALNLLAARIGRHRFGDDPDEREHQIDARANRIGLVILEILGIGVAGFSGVISEFARAAFPADPAGATAILLANGALAASLISAVSRELIQIVHFRMMAA